MSDQAQVVWEPHPGSQHLFLTCPFDELLYHGTRGPGKTEALLMDFAQDVGVGYGEHWRGVLFRQTYRQLDDLIAKSQRWFRLIFPQARFNAGDFTWRWPTGEMLLLRYIDRTADYWNYHGFEFPWIGWDELTNWPTSEVYEMMMACSRCSIPGVPKRVRGAANPWGSGHHWVKQRFIDHGPAGVPIVVEHKNPLTGQKLVSRRGHLFGSLFENVHLLRSSPEYVARLMATNDPNLRKAWLFGSWDIVAGGFFADLYRPATHKIEHPFAPPASWKCWTSFDWGSASPFSLGLWAISDGTKAPNGQFYPRGAMLRFDEWYGSRPEAPSEGLRLTNKALGKAIGERLATWENRGIRFQTGVADPSIWAEDGGKSIYAQIQEGLREAGWTRNLWAPADNERVPGWQELRGRLEGTEDRGPELYVMANCKHWLRTVPVLQRDEKNWEDLDTKAEDHAADETRYACMKVRRGRSAIIQLGGL